MARKILLADDSVTAQNMGRKILTEAGYEVITVNNGSAALKRITEQKPDVIVLDVYMPGYGGLEVCHRLKENPETARIPVLLTVGKLEPFKVEEARRVRADMHIVKPFDTSELLTAIAKLEDRIVAQAEMPKKGRFAKPGAEDVPPPDSFGDQQSGWKSRLIAPRKKAKAEKSETKAEVSEETKEAAHREQPARTYTMEEGAEEQTLNTADWRTLLSAREAEERAASKQTTPDVREDARADDVRSEEQETLEAKGEGRRKKRDEREATQTKGFEPAQEIADEKVGGGAQERAGEKDVQVREVRSSDHEPAEAASYRSAAEIVARAEAAVNAEKEQASAEARLAPTASQSAKQDQDEHKTGDRDVADALASLVPAQSASDSRLESERELVAAASGQSEVRGPRWVAQAVLVSQEESSSLLEQEMELAFKQFAAAEPAATFVMGPLEAMSFSSPDDEESPPHITNANRVEKAERKMEASAVTSEPQPEPQAVPPSVAEGQTTEQEAKSTAEAPAPAQGPAMGALWMSTPAAYVAATTNANLALNQEAPPANAEVPSSETVVAESAFAAAASAAAPSFTGYPETPQPKSENKESELAAAWQSWRQGRDGEPQPAVDVVPEPEVKTEAHNENHDEAHGEEISSLVDTMLAELKPKLMKEIAKKMGKEKDKEKGKR